MFIHSHTNSSLTTLRTILFVANVKFYVHVEKASREHHNLRPVTNQSHISGIKQEDIYDVKCEHEGLYVDI